MPRGKTAKRREEKAITILDLGAGKKPKWLSQIAKRHPKRLFEAVDIKKAWLAFGYPRNLRRTRRDALKRLKQLPANSIVVMTANLALADIFHERIKRKAALLIKTREKEPKTLEEGLHFLRALLELPEVFPPEFLHEVKRVLKPKGAFVIVTVEKTASFYKMQLDEHFRIITRKLSKEEIGKKGTKTMKEYLRTGLPLVKMICRPR